MLSTILVVICATICLYRIVRYMFERPPNYPPGPPKLPFIGSYPFILPLNYKHLHRATETLARWYRTPVLGFHYAGNVPAMTVHDTDTALEMLRNPDFDGRAIFDIIRARDPDFDAWGIFFTDGPMWQQQRRFTLHHLRDAGFGRRFEGLEMVIDDQLRAFVDLVRNGAKYEYERDLVHDDGIVELPLAAAGHLTNVMLHCTMGECLEREDMGVVLCTSRAAIRFMRNGCMFGRLFSMLPWTKWFAPLATGYTAVRESSMEMHGFVKKVVDKEFTSFDASHERHFLDAYFKEMLNDNVDGEFHCEYHHVNFDIIYAIMLYVHLVNQLYTIVIDLIFPTMSTMSFVLSFLLQRLVLNPACAARIQRDLDNVIGRSRSPTLDDRVHLPYLDAAMRESMRMDTLLPNNAAHRATRDTQLAGFDVPAGSVVIVVLQQLHESEMLFPDALSFRPERFLNEHGQLDRKLDKSLPFGAGKRVCIGETFARNLMFLVMATILQNFDLSVPDGETLDDPQLERQITGIVKSPRDFRLKFTSR